MTESTVSERIPHRWYARPVFFVSDVEGAIRFYIDKLGFEKRWHEADGKGKVCQVNRGECEIILWEDAARRDKGRLFVVSSQQVAICRIQLRRCEGRWCRRKPREYAKFGKGAKIWVSYVAAECDSSQPRAIRRIWGDPVLVRHILSRLGTT